MESGNLISSSLLSCQYVYFASFTAQNQTLSAITLNTINSCISVTVPGVIGHLLC